MTPHAVPTSSGSSTMPPSSTFMVSSSSSSIGGGGIALVPGSRGESAFGPGDEPLSEMIPGVGTFFLRKDRVSRKRRRAFVDLGRSQQAKVKKLAHTVIAAICGTFCPNGRMDLLDEVVNAHRVLRGHKGVDDSDSTYSNESNKPITSPRNDAMMASWEGEGNNGDRSQGGSPSPYLSIHPPTSEPTGRGSSQQYNPFLGEYPPPPSSFRQPSSHHRTAGTHGESASLIRRYAGLIPTTTTTTTTNPSEGHHLPSLESRRLNPMSISSSSAPSALGPTSHPAIGLHHSSRPVPEEVLILQRMRQSTARPRPGE